MELESMLTRPLIEEYRKRGYWNGETVCDFLDRATEHYPHKVAVVDAHTRVTYQELQQKVNALAKHLVQLGVKSQDRVCVQMPNWVEFIYAYLALERIGAIMVPVNVAYREAEVRFTVQYSEAVAAIIPASFNQFSFTDMYASLWPELPSLQHIIVAGTNLPASMINMKNLLEGCSNEVDLAEYRPRGTDINVILYTSGTMAQPKGVIFTHDAFEYGTKSLVRELQITSKEVFLALAPISHQLGLWVALNPMLFAGASIVMLERFDPQKALELIEQEHCTFPVGPAPMLLSILHEANKKEYEISSLRVFFSGGAHLPAEVVRGIATTLDCVVLNGYGMTEAPGALITRLDDPEEVIANTVGRPFPPALAVRIVDDANNEVGEGEIGEAIFKGPSLFVGYFRNKTATAEAIDHDGWLHSGDLAVKRDDGNYCIAGRKKDMINRGGQSIYPEEVEDLLYENPKIAQVAMVPMPDPRLGERNCLYAVPRPGQSITLEEIIAFLEAKRIAKYKLPERLEVLNSLPLGPTGKVLKRVLKEEIACKIKGETAAQQE